MLNGIDPIIIFQFSKLTSSESESLSKIPVVSQIVSKIGLPPIPIYLSEKLTGLYIDSTDKNIDIETTNETLTNGAAPIVKQKAINSTVRINMKAESGSTGLMLLAALADLIIPKVTSREYSISFLSGSTVILGGLLHSFSVNQNFDNTLMNVTLELAKNYEGEKKAQIVIDKTPDATSLAGGSGAVAGGAGSVGGSPPMGPLNPPLAGPPPSTPSAPAPIKLGPLN